MQNKKRMFENIYDLMKGGQFEGEAKKELRKWIARKNIEIDYTEGKEATIKIGRDFTITLKGFIK